MRRHRCVCAAVIVAGRFAQLLRGRVPPAAQPGRNGGIDRWQALAQPIPGYSTIDGLPVAVVVVRRESETGRLEVVRGHHPTAEWPGAAAPAGARRHLIPASSFNPPPRRELSIGEEHFFFNTVARSVTCRGCGRDDVGFGFVSSGRTPAGDRTLCERCADKQALVAAR